MSLRLRTVYATVPAFRAVIGRAAGDTADDDRLWDALVDIADLIDLQYGGSFVPWTGTRAGRVAETGQIWVTDLLAVTSLVVDDGLGGTQTTVTSGQYALYPPEAPTLSPPWPYTQIRRSTTDVSFPVAGRALVTGRWAHYEVPRAVTLLQAAATISDETIQVETAVLERGHTILIESEQLLVTAVEQTVAGATDAATVVRAMNGTTAAAHALGAAVSVMTFPLVEQAALLQAHRSFRRADTPFGMPEMAASGGPIWVRELDPDVQHRISLLKVPFGGVR